MATSTSSKVLYVSGVGCSSETTTVLFRSWAKACRAVQMSNVVALSSPVEIAARRRPSPAPTVVGPAHDPGAASAVGWSRSSQSVSGLCCCSHHPDQEHAITCHTHGICKRHIVGRLAYHNLSYPEGGRA